ncbi:MAG: DUF5696 domain-containing protein [bacterium]|nr:DUF5696 domain-containing protein [bacterium]
MRNKLFKRAAGILTGIALLCTLAPAPSVRAAEREIPDRMELVASNDSLELYLDRELADLAVRVKATGDVWFTNPQEADEDPLASNYYKNLMKSQFSIRYFNANVQASEMDSYTDAVAEGQFDVEEIRDGVKISYQMGDVADKFVLPQIISEERYAYYTGLMDEKDAKNVGRNYLYLNREELTEDKRKDYLERYPVLEEYPIYVLKESVKDYKKEELTEYFQGAGYTVQEMEQDNLANGYESTSRKPWFNIAVSYYLEGDAFVAEIDPETVEYDTEKYYLVDIDLLEYFGAGSAEEEGYLFVPDGSGALIYFDNGKLSAPAYIGYVYGEDKTSQVNLTKKPEIDQSVTVRMPVFGLKKGDSAFFAIVEGGAAGADINAASSGKTDSYNQVYAGFSYLTYGAISLGDMVGSNSFQMYSQPVFQESFKVRYSFLSGEEANYAGMASYYQGYLQEQGVLGERTEGSGTPLYLNFIGAIRKSESVLGIKCKVTQELTTYEQAAEAVRELAAEGVENIKVEYSGWSSGGLHGKAPGGTKSLSCLNGGGTDLEDFLREMESAGIPVFHTAQLQYVYSDGAFDGYRPESYAPRYYDNTVARANSYLIPNGMKTNQDRIEMISPYYVGDMVDSFLKKTKKYGLTGISVEDLASNLFSDFNNRHYVNRQEAAEYNGAAMEKLAAGCGGNLLGSNANVYAWKYLSDIKNVPLDSNRTQLIDDAVPFYEMVLHGYRDYTGEPVNLSGDVNTMLLKSVEAGAGLSFEWICGDNSLLKNTEFDGLYSVGFQDWKDTAVLSWSRVNEAMGDLRSLRIIGHERPQTGVTCTVYEDGTRVIVNYNKYEVTYQGNTVKAQDFLVVKEG